MDGDGWHRGVIGILASRIVDQTGKPAIVVTRAGAPDGPDSGTVGWEDGEAYGSGRSIAAFHLLNAIESCHDLFTRFGGHAHAVGFSLPADRVPDLRDRLCSYAADHLREEDLGASLDCHGELPLHEVTPQLESWLRQMEPFGMGNDEPVFVARNVRVVAAPRIMKERHVRLRVCQGTSFSAVGWNLAEQVAALHIGPESVIDLAYRVRQNEHPEFGGLELEIVALDNASFPAAAHGVS
jgi:single-stranded-DNA-specific exonuclease